VSTTKIFRNKGELDIRAFTTFGLSAKEKDNAIGKFGTGLKYAIAVMMREGLELKIMTGGKTYTFETKDTDFRGKDFQQIVCRMVDTKKWLSKGTSKFDMPFTTEFGKNWQPWQVYRELASNCMDEDGEISDASQDQPAHNDNDTLIFAELPVAHSDVFMNSTIELMHNDVRLEVYDAPGEHIYYQGIRVMELDKPSRFTYNLKSANLTEDRTLNGSYAFNVAITTWVTSLTDENLIKFFIAESKDKFEGVLDYSYADQDNVSPEFMQYFRANPLLTEWANSSAYALAHGMGKLKGDIIAKDASYEEATKITDGVEFLQSIGYAIHYPIKLSDHLGDYIVAFADRANQTIWLTSKLLADTPRQIAAGILEEYLHLEEGVDDYSREMQNLLFEEIIKQGAKRAGIEI